MVYTISIVTIPGVVRAVLPTGLMKFTPKCGLVTTKQTLPQNSVIINYKQNILPFTTLPPNNRLINLLLTSYNLIKLNNYNFTNIIFPQWAQNRRYWTFVKTAYVQRRKLNQALQIIHMSYL